jgi:predicted metal-dependent phosphoesterase TrpH
LPPRRLVAAAREQAVSILALTDHDTTEGLEEALEAGRGYGVDVIPGVEINTDVGEHEVHILGYWIDYTQASLQSFLRRMRAGRLERAEEIVRKLRALGVPIEWSRVGKIAAGASLGRPHIARALVEAGRVGSTREAFERFIGRHGPAYVPRLKLAPEEAVETIARHDGVPVLAHPGWASSGPVIEQLPQLVAHGLAGIEVYYPDHTPEMVAEYRHLAERYGLAVTGGTDYHGGGLATRVPLGSVPIPPEVVPELRARWEALRAAARRPEQADLTGRIGGQEA